MAAIFGFNGCGRLGSGKKFVPREWSTAKNKERGGGRGVKVTPARSRCYFGNFCSPTKGVPYWCG